MSEERFFGGLLPRVCVPKKNHIGTEVTEKGCDLCLRDLCASVVQLSSQKRGSVRASSMRFRFTTPAHDPSNANAERTSSVADTRIFSPDWPSR